MSQDHSAEQLGGLFSQCLDMLSQALPAAVAAKEPLIPGGLILREHAGDTTSLEPFVAPELAGSGDADTAERLFDVVAAELEGLVAGVVFHAARHRSLGTVVILEGEHAEGRTLAFALPYEVKRSFMKPPTVEFGELVTLEQPMFRFADLLL